MIRPSSSFFALSLLFVLSAPLVGCGGATSDDTAQTQPGSAGSAGSGLGGSGQAGDAGAGGAAAGAGGSAGGSAGGAGEAGAGGAVTGGAGGGSAGTGGAAAGTGGFQTAPHANAPSMPYHGGPLLKSPQLVTITFPGYPHKDKVESFGDFVVTSKWLDAVGGEYGIGAGAHVAKVVMADAAPATIDDKAVQTWLKSKIADGTLPTPADAKNDYLYMIYYPQSTTITLQGDKSCQGFLGYHSGYTSNGVNFSYAVMPACSQAVTGMNQLASIIFSASHELIEAATDALPLSKPGYSYDDYMNPWTFMGSEVGDVCIDLGFSEGGFTMQRSWSNAAAKEGKDPCVPAPSDIMFNVSAAPSGTQVAKAGDTLTYTLTGWSSEQIAAWQLEAYTYQGNFDPNPKLSATKINNGEKVTLTLTIPSNVPKQSVASVAIFSAKSQADYHVWPVAVYVQLGPGAGGTTPCRPT